MFIANAWKAIEIDEIKMSPAKNNRGKNFGIKQT
jgi:hypothetical protein